MEQGPADGRRARSERSRQAVIDALLGLYESGVVAPSVAEIAAASGVSERSVFRHFTDLEDLAAAALATKVAEVMPYFADPDHDGTLDGRIGALVDQRLALHDRLVNLAHAASYHAVRSPTVAAALTERRTLLRNQIGRILGPELDGLPARRRRLLHAELDQALSLEALDYLRVGAPDPLDDRAARAALTATIHALIASTPVRPEPSEAP